MRWCILVRVRASLAMAGISEARLFFTMTVYCLRRAENKELSAMSSACLFYEDNLRIAF
jgi:hypothetical protein